jgi:hypothetical protein
VQLTRWNLVLVREFGALMGDSTATDQAQQAAFEFTSLVLGYNQSRRLLNERASRMRADRAYASIITRLSAPTLSG